MCFSLAAQKIFFRENFTSGPISGSCAAVRPVPSTFAACSPPVAFAPVRPARCPSRRAARPVPLAVRPVRRMSAQPSASDLAAVRPVTVKGVNLSACRAVLPDVMRSRALDRAAVRRVRSLFALGVVHAHKYKFIRLQVQKMLYLFFGEIHI